MFKSHFYFILVKWELYIRPKGPNKISNFTTDKALMRLNYAHILTDTVIIYAVIPIRSPSFNLYREIDRRVLL